MALDFGCAAEGAAAGLLSGGVAEVAAVASIDFSGFPLFLDSSRENNALYIADASCDGSTFVFFFFFFFGRSTGTTASVGGSGGAWDGVGLEAMPTQPWPYSSVPEDQERRRRR